MYTFRYARICKDTYRSAASEISEDQWAGHSWDLCAGTGAPGSWDLRCILGTWKNKCHLGTGVTRGLGGINAMEDPGKLMPLKSSCRLGHTTLFQELIAQFPGTKMREV